MSAGASRRYTALAVACRLSERPTAAPGPATAVAQTSTTFLVAAAQVSGARPNYSRSLPFVAWKNDRSGLMIRQRAAR